MQSQDFGVIDSISSDTTIQGIELVLDWNCLEGATQGDYSAGFAYVDAYMAKLASLAVPKHLILKVEEGNPSTYLINAGLTGLSTDGSYTFVSIWTQAGMDRLIALSNAYAARYNSNALFEMFTPAEETALPVSTTLGATVSALSTQFTRLTAAAHAAWTTTQVRVPVNFLGADSDMRGLIDGVKASGVAYGGPDTYPEPWRMLQSNPIFRGLNSDLSANGAWTDLRGQYAWVAEVESTELGPQFGGPNGNWTLQQIQTYAHDTMHDNYIIWYANTWYGPVTNQWTAQLAFIRAGTSAVYSTSCPSAYTAGCNTN